ncbi:hypothetical protein T07_13261 [Trichinella nelsoni]|uniref:Uncharacterized protein n=1 Tax=Trichinella nelsoni TaxID=6336 RepID=A0A0V0SGG0_9BILA|nr:hypothetical protein T07_13261 [Trichinella nelsoni]
MRREKDRTVSRMKGEIFLSATGFGLSNSGRINKSYFEQVCYVKGLCIEDNELSTAQLELLFCLSQLSSPYANRIWYRLVVITGDYVSRWKEGGEKWFGFGKDFDERSLHEITPSSMGLIMRKK